MIAGVLCKRLWLLFTSFIVPNVQGAPGILTGSSWSMLGAYAPTLPELAIVIGVVSLGVLGFMGLSGALLMPAAKTGAARPRVEEPVAEADAELAV